MLRNLAMVLCSIGFVFLLMEGFLRLWSGDSLRKYDLFPQGLICERHALLGWLGRPGAEGSWTFREKDMEDMQIRMNDEGFWDRDVARKKPHGVQRILFLGDSFTIGFGIDEPYRFSSRMRASLPPGGEVINMGMWGYSTGQELLVLEEFGLARDPDVVVLALFLDDLFCSRLYSVNDGLYQKPRFHLSLDGGLSLRNVPVPGNRGFSRFWNFAVTRISDLRNRFEVGARAWRLGWFSVFDRAYAAEHGFTLSLALLGRIHDLCSAEGIELLVALIPYKDQLAARTIQSAGRPYLGIPPERLDLLLPQKVIKAYCRKRGVAFLDLLPVMERQPNPDGLYFKRDLHWSRRGHEVAAEAILRKLHDLTGQKLKPARGRP